MGRAVRGRRDQVVLATKFGLVSHSGGGPGHLDSRPANVRTAVEGSLRRLGTDYIDLYYQHRADPNAPIEDTVGLLAQLVQEGKIRHIGLSEAGTDTIRRAIAPIPGTKRVARVEENTAADRLVLSAEQLKWLSNLTPATGERHDEGNRAIIER